MQPINIADYEDLARQRLDPLAWDYFQGGADDEVTLRANRAAFERIRLRPRVLVDVSQRDLGTTLLGTPVSMPIAIAPTAFQCLAHVDGECATAQAAGAAATLMIVSTSATRSIEEVAAAASGPLWFQLYCYKDRSISAALVQRAEALGYRALVLTLDAQRTGRRERDIRNGFALPPHLRLANFADAGLAQMVQAGPGGSSMGARSAALYDLALTWEALDWFRGITRLPIVVKGVLTAEDAALAVAHGAAGIIVSNHGGRQLDGVPATIEVLPEVVAAVRAAGGGCEVYVDGGVRRGTDVLKALALGAQAVLVGRPVIWGLAADGASGAQHVLELLRAELDLAMLLAGRPTLASIDAALVRVGPPA